MPTSRVEIIVEGKDQASGALRSVGSSMEELGGHAGRLGGALGRMGEIAGGILGAQAIVGLGRAVGGAVKEAFEATANYERLGMALENLSKKDLLRAGTVEKMVQVGTQEVSQTGKNAQAIVDLTLKRDLLMAKMKEQQERHRQLIAKWGEEGLAVQTHAAQMAIDQQAIDKVNGKLAELGEAGSKTVAVYKKVTEQFISDAEAKEMAARSSKELLGWIEQLAIKSPFTQEAIQNAFKTAMAYGFVSDQAADLMLKTGQIDEAQRANTVTAQRLTQAMVDFSAGAGLSTETIGRVALALGQIQARGKLAGQEVMQLTEAGISVHAILAQAFGKSTAEIIKMQEKGLIPANQAILAITQSLEKDFGGAAAAQTNTLSGLVSSLSDIKSIGLREFFSGTFEALQPYLANFTVWAAGIIPRLSEIGAALGTHIAGALQTIGGIIQSLQSGGVGGLLNALGLPPEAATLIQTVANNVQLLAGAAGSFFTTLAGGTPNLGALREGLAGIDAGLPGLVGNVTFLGSTIGGMIQEVVGSFQTDWLPMWDTVRMAVEDALGRVRSIVASVLTLITGSVADHATSLKASFFEAYERVRSIVASVVGSIQSIVTSILGAVQTFVANHGQEIRQFLGDTWEQVARIVNLAVELIQATIVPILAGIASFLRSHSEEIQSFLAGAWTVISTIIRTVLGVIEGLFKTVLAVLRGDWEAAWTAIKETAETIWTGIKTIVETVFSGLVKWIIAKIDELKADWARRWDAVKEKVATTVAGIVTAIEDKVDEILGAVRGFLEDIRTTIEEFDLKEAAWSLIGGFIRGIIEKVEDVKNAIISLVRQAIAAAKAALGIKSPSRVFWEIGQAIPEGLAAGILANMDVANSALQEVTDSLEEAIVNIVSWLKRLAEYFAQPGAGLDSAQAVIEPLVKVFEGLEKVLGAIGTLISTTWETGALEAAIGRLGGLVEPVKAIVEELKRLAEYFAQPGAGLDSAQAVTEPLAKVFGALANIIEGLKALISLELAEGVGEHIRQVVGVLVEASQELVRALAEAAANFSSDGLIAAQALAETMGAIGGQLRNMVDGLTAVAGYVPQEIGAQLETMMAQLMGVARKFIREAGTFDAKLLAGAAVFAEVVGRITAPLRSMVDAFTAVAEYVPQQIGPALERMVLQLQGTARKFIREAATFDADLLAGAAVFAEVVGRITAPLKGMVEAFEAVAEYVPKRIGPALEILVLQLIGTARKFVREAGTFDAELLAAAAVFAETLGKFVAPLRTAIDTFNDIAKYVPEKIGPIMETLIQQLIGTARKFVREASAFDADLLAAAIVLAEAFGKFVAPLKAAIEAFEAVAGYVPKEIGPTLATLIGQLKELARTLGDAAADVGDISKAAAFAEQAGKLTGFVRGAIDALAALAEYKSIADLSTKVGDFVKDLWLAIKIMVAQFRRMSDQVKAWMTTAGEFAQLAGQIIGVVRGGIEAITALADYKAAVDLRAKAELFVKDLWLAVKVMVDQFRRMSDQVKTWMTTAAEFARLAGQIVGVVQPGITAIKALADYTAAQNIAAAVGAFVVDILIVAQALQEGLGGLTDPLKKGYDAAIEFAQRIQSIIGVVQPGIAAIKALAEYVAAERLAAAVGAFVADVLLLAQDLRDGLGGLSDPLKAAYDAAIEFGERIGKIVGFVKPALDAIAALASYRRALMLAANVQAFVLDIVLVAELLRSGLSGVTDQMLELYDAAIQFAQRIQGVIGFVQPALAAIAALTEYRAARDIAAKTQAFIADILIVAQELRNGLGNLAPELLLALEAAQVFTDRVKGIFEFIKPAIDTMRALREYARPYGVGTGVLTLLRDLQMLIEWLNTFATEIGEDTIGAALRFASILEAIVASITAALAGLVQLVTAYSAGELVGRSWIDGIIDGLTSRLPDLEALMGYIRGLFPSSPAKHGPFRILPSGTDVGGTWAGGLVSGIGGAIKPLTSVLDQLSSTMAMGPAARTARVNAPVTVNLGGTWNVRSDSDIRRIAEEIGAVLSQQASINRRMNLGWTS